MCDVTYAKDITAFFSNSKLITFPKSTSVDTVVFSDLKEVDTSLPNTLLQSYTLVVSVRAEFECSCI